MCDDDWFIIFVGGLVFLFAMLMISLAFNDEPHHKHHRDNHQVSDTYQLQLACINHRGTWVPTANYCSFK